jgi:hypothetical protein
MFDDRGVRAAVTQGLQRVRRWLPPMAENNWRENNWRENNWR